VLKIGNYRVKILKASHMKLDEVELQIQNNWLVSSLFCWIWARIGSVEK
jgi:hypothetical protein